MDSKPQIPVTGSDTSASGDATGSDIDQVDDKMQAEIDAAMGDMKAAMAGHDEPAKAPKKIHGPREIKGGREHRAGTVVSVGLNDVFVEFGPKELGVVERNQWKDGAEPPAVGKELEVVVQRFDAGESIFICALPGAVQKADWELLEAGQTVEARVTGVNKGGLELEIASHRAFMPAGQVSLDHITDLSVFVGEKMVCQIQRMDRRGGGNIVLSRRNILAEERKKKAEELKQTLQEGQTIEGTVRKIMPFGAFIDLGGIDGLVHASDLSHDRIGHGEKAIEKHIKEGEHVKVQVLKLDWDNNRISLGIKQLQEDPFQTALSEIVEGAELTGRVSNIADFGAFIELSKGIEGLVHISELDYKRVNTPGDVVKVDEVVRVKVLKIDTESRRISLSIKALKEAPAAPAGKGRGRGRGGKGEADTRTAEEILKETPAQRRLREKAKQNAKSSSLGSGGLGDIGGMGLGDLKL